MLSFLVSEPVSETEASTTLSTSQTEILTSVSGTTTETSSVETISVSAPSSSQITTQVSTGATATTAGSIQTGNKSHKLCKLKANEWNKHFFKTIQYDW